MTYDFKKIEKKWQDHWFKNDVFKTELDTSKEKYYILDMFPYPSGAGLHVGHPKGYTGTDILARYKRMKGFNVLHPMGWDSFGLPAERYAVKTGQHPSIITEKNCNKFKEQLQQLGMSYDWTREIKTSDPKYYKWTQWIFTVLFERGLAYEREFPVNWCPALSTVLANEEVKDGKYVETGDPVEKRMMKQWMLKITAYAERLISDLDLVDWPESVKTMQREWIGRSEGADVTFTVKETGDKFTVFTTRPDTLFGATFCVLAPAHPLVKKITSKDHKEKTEAYVKEAAAKSNQDRMKEEKDKTGVFIGAHAVNPVNGKEIPIFIADYVLEDYGYGAIMAVPAHDQRDYDFAKKFDLDIIPVIEGGEIEKEAYVGNGKHINSDFLDGTDVATGKRKMNDWLESKKLGKATITYNLRDWLFARQRYWGEPFPIKREKDGTIHVLPVKDLPLTLPELDDYKPTAEGKPPLSRAKNWEEKGYCTDTMPQWAGSCWYYLRFCDPWNDDKAWSEEAEKYFMPVDLYVGGTEHAVLHLLYARFWHKVLFDAGYVSTPEPFQRLFNQGMIVSQSYQDCKGKYYHPSEVERTADGYVLKETGEKLATQIEKMSKSKLNVISVDDATNEYGADSLRLFEAFMGPLEREGIWTDEGITGVHRFLKRVYNFYFTEDDQLSANVQAKETSPDLLKELHKAIKGVTNDLDALSFNTAIAKMMEFMNAAYKAGSMSKDSAEKFALLLAPFASHLAEEIWEKLGHQKTLAYEPWPVFDPAMLEETVIKIPVQVMGKLRTVLEVSKDIQKDELLSMAKADAKVAKYLEGQKIVKEIFIPGKMINFVTAS